MNKIVRIVIFEVCVEWVYLRGGTESLTGLPVSAKKLLHFSAIKVEFDISSPLTMKV